MANPAIWDSLITSYQSARAAERAYYAEHIDPLVPDTLPVGPERDAAVRAISGEVWSEAQRICDVRLALEDVLLDIPSPDLTAFALKVIICRADGRDLSGLDDLLVAEATRLTSGEAAA